VEVFMSVQATLQALGRQMELFDRAAALPGRPRERLIALSEAEELFFRLHPHHYRALQLVRIASQIGTASRKNRDLMRPCESKLLSHLMGIIREAVDDEELSLPDLWQPGELAFTLWALAFGTRALMNTAVAVNQLGIVNGFKTSRQTMDLMLDALDWRPLSWEWDYEQTRQRSITFLLAREPRPQSGR
jgi:hypothetical protein